MIRIGITGVPSSGKTTLSRAISASCRNIPELKRVELVNEYARRYISKHGNITSIFEQYRILEKQLEWEDSVCNEKLDLMITDSPIFLGFLYCCELPRSTSKEIMYFNDVFKKMVKLNAPNPRYDIVLHLEHHGHVLIDDGVQKSEQLTDSWRTDADTMIRATMKIFKPKEFIVVKEKILEERVREVINYLTCYLKK